MISHDSVKINGKFRKHLKGVIERRNFEVGVLQDRPHKIPAKGKGTKTLAGGPARKIGRKSSEFTISEVSNRVRKQTGINFYTRPFRMKQNKEIIRFVKVFFNSLTGRGTTKQLENALQAIVRNPITRGDYGKNKGLTAKIKGFNRLLIDTGQLFKAIRARVTKRV